MWNRWVQNANSRALTRLPPPPPPGSSRGPKEASRVIGSERAPPAGPPNRTVGSFTAMRSSSHVSREPNRCRAQGYRGGPALLRCTYQSRLCEMCGPRHLLPRSSPGPLCRPVQEKVSRQTAPSTGTKTHTRTHNAQTRSRTKKKCRKRRSAHEIVRVAWRAAAATG
jgi:hypothetical protein